MEVLTQQPMVWHARSNCMMRGKVQLKGNIRRQDQELRDGKKREKIKKKPMTHVVPRWSPIQVPIQAHNCLTSVIREIQCVVVACTSRNDTTAT